MIAILTLSKAYIIIETVGFFQLHMYIHIICVCICTNVSVKLSENVLLVRILILQRINAFLRNDLKNNRQRKKYCIYVYVRIA